MNRLIKFRAWNRDKAVMQYNPPFGLFQYTDHYFNENKLFEFMQFTNLLDKNGKEIYEGDVARWGDSDGLRQIIEWNPHKGAWGACDSSGACSETLWATETCEVIGNIYENPGLV